MRLTLQSTLSTQSRVTALLLAFRPKTLTAALIPIVAGTALVSALGLRVQLWISICALLASVLIQIGTNLVNDAVDFKKGADNENRIGPQRITQAGFFSSSQVMLFGTIAFGLAIALGVPLVWQGGWPILTIGLVSVLCGYAYTAGPFPLAYRGLGEVFVILFFGLIAVMGLVYLHTLQWRIEAFVMGLQIGLHCTVLIAVNNLRDVAGDVKVHKRTLPVRFGVAFGRWEIAALVGLPFVFLLYWFLIDRPLAAFLPLAAVPLAVRLVRQVFATEPSPLYNSFLGQAAGLHLLFGFLLSVGLVL